MSLLVTAWVVSIVGAALFFAAGAVWRSRRGAAARAELRDELERVGAEGARAAADVAQLLEQRSRLREDFDEARAELADLGGELERARRELAQCVEDNVRLAREAHRTRGLRPRPLLRAEPGSRSDALQTIIAREIAGDRVHGAVITDELGLVVAAVGDYGDALAAFGAYLADVGTKSRDMLPLRNLRQVIVQDEHEATLTVRPIASDDAHLSLVTFAMGTT